MEIRLSGNGSSFHRSNLLPSHSSLFSISSSPFSPLFFFLPLPPLSSLARLFVRAKILAELDLYRDSSYLRTNIFLMEIGIALIRPTSLPSPPPLADLEANFIRHWPAFQRLSSLDSSSLEFSSSFESIEIERIARFVLARFSQLFA